MRKISIARDNNSKLHRVSGVVKLLFFRISNLVIVLVAVILVYIFYAPHKSVTVALTLYPSSI